MLLASLFRLSDRGLTRYLLSIHFLSVPAHEEGWQDADRDVETSHVGQERVDVVHSSFEGVFLVCEFDHHSMERERFR